MAAAAAAATLALGAPLAAPLAAQVPATAWRPVAASGVEIDSTRPIPYRLLAPGEYARAMARGTRTDTGAPGAKYWQQRASYRIDARYDPATGRLTGSETILYTNQSPDTLQRVYLHLRPNLFAPSALRNRTVPVTDTVALARVAIGGQALARTGNPPLRLGEAPPPRVDSGYVVSGTILGARLPQPLAPGQTVQLELGWSYVVPPAGAPRGGRMDSTAVISYWYPQMAVYDDLRGWMTDQYMGNAEFYMGYADYDLSLTVPAGWLVAATGVLQNPEQVLSKPVRDRLARARKTRDIVHVVTEAERGAGKSTAAAGGGEGTLTWRFRAENVRDVVWGASAQWLWDATQATTGAASGAASGDRKSAKAGPTAIYSFWRPDGRSSYWQENNRYLRFSIEFLSKFLWPYPYPVMNAIHGPDSCGGMEYPMATCIGRAGDSTGMFGVTVHETAHMWFPMQVGSNETAHGWQDEGLTQFNEAQASRAFFADTSMVNDELQNRNGYLSLARSGLEEPMMRHGDLYPSYFAYAISSYSKTASLLTALRALYGEETFNRAYREYGRRWQYKHPTPYDMWRTFDQVSGRDLWWFWRSWFFEDWRLDQAIAGVAVRGDSAAITVEDRGLVPMPVRLAVTHADGSVERLEAPVEPWLRGARRYVVAVPARGGVTKVEIDPEQRFPDVDHANQVWTAPAGGVGSR